jgi:hypothetical protein
VCVLWVLLIVPTVGRLRALRRTRGVVSRPLRWAQCPRAAWAAHTGRLCVLVQPELAVALAPAGRPGLAGHHPASGAHWRQRRDPRPIDWRTGPPSPSRRTPACPGQRAAPADGRRPGPVASGTEHGILSGLRAPAFTGSRSGRRRRRAAGRPSQDSESAGRRRGIMMLLYRG